MWLRLRPYAVAWVLQLPWLLVLPIALGLWNEPIPLEFSSSFTDSLLRSLIVALLTSLLCVVGGLSLAWFCRPVATRTAQFLMQALLIPVLVGPIAAGFLAKLGVIKIAFISGAIASRDPIPTLLFVLTVYGFQYGPLCFYVLWLRARTVPFHLTQYARSAGLTASEFAADVLWPHCRPLFSVLFVLVFMLTATEFVATDLSIRPSIGTETALLSHWLAEQYRSWLPAGYDLAASELAAYGIVSAAIVVLSCLVISAGLCRGIDAIVRRKRLALVLPFAGWRLSGPRQWLAEAVAIAAPLACISPLIFSYIAFPPRPFPDSAGLASALLWSVPAASTMVVLAVGLAILIRLAMRRGSLGSLGTDVIYVFAMNPLAVPALVVSIAAFRWLGSLGVLRNVGLPAGWLVGHALLAMPVLGAFALYLHTQVSDGELDYQRIAGLRSSEVIRFSFWDRLQVDYLLVLLFGWSLAWNDGVINRAAASDLPSLYSIMAPRLSVRPDYRAAQFGLLLSVIIATVMVALWQRTARRVGASQG